MRPGEVMSSLMIRLYFKSTTVDGLNIFMGTNFRGFNKNDIFVGFNIRGHNVFLHSSYRKSLFRGYLNSWVGPSTKTTKIGTPRKLSHTQYVEMPTMLDNIISYFLGSLMRTEYSNRKNGRHCEN